MIYKTFDIILVPFPFSESSISKKRPALVLSHAASFNIPCNHTVLAMITSAQHNQWQLDTIILDLLSAGLPKESVVRMKLFTIDNQLIIKKLGTLGAHDQKTIQKNLLSIYLGQLYLE